MLCSIMLFSYRLISDLVVVIVSAAIGGIIFSCLGQPVRTCTFSWLLQFFFGILVLMFFFLLSLCGHLKWSYFLKFWELPVSVSLPIPGNCWLPSCWFTHRSRRFEIHQWNGTGMLSWIELRVVLSEGSIKLLSHVLICAVLMIVCGHELFSEDSMS